MKMLIAIIAVALVGAQAQADVKIGYVDMQKAIQGTKAGQKAKKDLEVAHERLETLKAKQRAQLNTGDMDDDSEEAILGEEFEAIDDALEDVVTPNKAKTKTAAKEFSKIPHKAELKTTKKIAASTVKVPIVKASTVKSPTAKASTKAMAKPLEKLRDLTALRTTKKAPLKK